MCERSKNLTKSRDLKCVRNNSNRSNSVSRSKLRSEGPTWLASQESEVIYCPTWHDQTNISPEMEKNREQDNNNEQDNLRK